MGNDYLYGESVGPLDAKVDDFRKIKSHLLRDRSLSFLRKRTNIAA